MVRRRSSVGSGSYPLWAARRLPFPAPSGPAFGAKRVTNLTPFAAPPTVSHFYFPPRPDCFPGLHDRAPGRCGHRRQPPSAPAATGAAGVAASCMAGHLYRPWRLDALAPDTEPFVCSLRINRGSSGAGCCQLRSDCTDPERRCVLVICQALNPPTHTDSAPAGRTYRRGDLNSVSWSR